VAAESVLVSIHFGAIVSASYDKDDGMTELSMDECTLVAGGAGIGMFGGGTRTEGDGNGLLGGDTERGGGALGSGA
jgi:hypothetical protein